MGMQQESGYTTEMGPLPPGSDSLLTWDLPGLGTPHTMGDLMYQTWWITGNLHCVWLLILTGL